MTESATSVGPPQLPTADFYLGAWLVQPSLGIVAHDSVPTHLEPKAMLVLVCLAQHVGEVVSKDEIIHDVWPETFVTEHVLTHAIWQLRHAFHDRDVIETVPRQGYRLRPTEQSETATTNEVVSVAEVAFARTQQAKRRHRARSLVASIQSAYAVVGALLMASFGEAAAKALREPSFFVHHSRVFLAGAAWLTAIYCSVTITAVAMWFDRWRVYGRFDRWFSAFCPLNILCGMFLLGATADWLYFQSGSVWPIVIALLLVPFLLCGPFFQRRLIRRYHLGRAPA